MDNRVCSANFSSGSFINSRLLLFFVQNSGRWFWLIFRCETRDDCLLMKESNWCVVSWFWGHWKIDTKVKMSCSSSFWLVCVSIWMLFHLFPVSHRWPHQIICWNLRYRINEYVVQMSTLYWKNLPKKPKILFKFLMIKN